jgi:hypothetical protein
MTRMKRGSAAATIPRAGDARRHSQAATKPTLSGTRSRKPRTLKYEKSSDATLDGVKTKLVPVAVAPGGF